MKRLSITKKPRKQVLSLIGVVLLIVIVITNTSDLIYLRGQIFTSYPNSVRSQLSKQLDLYQQGYNSAVAGYFSNALTTIENLASSNDTLTDIQQNKPNNLSVVFQHQEAYDQQFDSISAFTANGNLLATSTDATTVNPALTLAGASLPLQKAVARRQPTITNAFYSRAHRNVIGFVAPIFASDNSYAGAISGTTTVSSLASRVNFLSSYNFISTVVTDTNGNILTEDNKPTAKLVNISKSEPLIQKVMNSGHTQQAYETNYRGEKVLAEVSDVSYKNAGSVYIISYIPQSYVNANITQIQSSIVHSSRIFVALLVTFFVVVIAFIWPRKNRQDIQ
jgi:hypothetical protein